MRPQFLFANLCKLLGVVSRQIRCCRSDIPVTGVKGMETPAVSLICFCNKVPIRYLAMLQPDRIEARHQAALASRQILSVIWKFSVYCCPVPLGYAAVSAVAVLNVICAHLREKTKGNTDPWTQRSHSSCLSLLHRSINDWLSVFSPSERLGSGCLVVVIRGWATQR